MLIVGTPPHTADERELRYSYWLEKEKNSQRLELTCVPLNTRIKLDASAVKPQVKKVPNKVWTTGLKFGNMFHALVWTSVKTDVQHVDQLIGVECRINKYRRDSDRRTVYRCTRVELSFWRKKIYKQVRPAYSSVYIL